MPVAWRYFVNATSFQHFAVSLVYLAQGWRPLSLCLHAVPGGDPDDPRYTSVWIRWPGWEQAQQDGSAPVIESRLTWRSDGGEGASSNRADMNAWLEAEALSGRYPFLLGAAGQGVEARYAAYTSDAAHPLREDLDGGRPVRESVAHLNVLATDGQAFHDYLTMMQDHQGAYVEWMAPHGNPSDPRVAIIWRTQPSWGGVADPAFSQGWVQRGVNVALDHQFDSANTVFREAAVYPRLLAPMPRGDGTHPDHYMVHDNDEIRGVDARSMDLASLVHTVDFMPHAGFWPLAIMGTELGPHQRFDLVFAEFGHLVPPARTLRIARLTEAGVTAGSQATTAAIHDGDVVQSAPAAHGVSAHAGAAQAVPVQGISVPGRGRGSAIAGASSTASPGRGRPARSARTSTGGRASAEQDDASLEHPDTLGVNLLQGAQTRALTPFGPTSAPLDDAALPAQPEGAELWRFANLDLYIVGQMKQHSIRSAQLAIAKGGKLKYAAAYTWAPASYPDTTVFQRMRLGSVSKVIASIALAKMAEDADVDLFTESLGTLFGLGPAHAVFQNQWFTRTAAQAACHVGYFASDPFLTQYLDPYAVATALHRANPQKPLQELLELDRKSFFEFILNTSPNDTANTVGYMRNVPAGELMPGGNAPTEYSNFGFDLVGDVVRERNESGRDYFEYLRLNILAPLRVPRDRVRPTIARAAEIASTPSEVRYHARTPQLGLDMRQGLLVGDVVHPDISAVATLTYDGFNYQLNQASGTMALAAIDAVRLFSVFDDPATPNPLFSDSANVAELIGTTFAQDRTLAYFGSPSRTQRQNGLLPQSATSVHRRINDGPFVGANSIVALLTFNTDILGDELTDLGLEGLEAAIVALDQGVGFPDWDLFTAPDVLESS